MNDPLVIKDITGVDNKTILECYKQEFTEESIEKILDALRPQGEWKHNNFDEHYCNKCGHYALWSEEVDDYYEVKSNFCPNCGADMRGEEE